MQEGSQLRVQSWKERCELTISDRIPSSEPLTTRPISSYLFQHKPNRCTFSQISVTRASSSKHRISMLDLTSHPYVEEMSCKTQRVLDLKRICSQPNGFDFIQRRQKFSHLFLHQRIHKSQN